MTLKAFIAVSTVFMTTLAAAADYKLPATMNCKPTICFAGSCSEETLSIKGLGVNKVISAQQGDQDMSAYSEIVESSKDAEVIDLVKLKIDFYEDGHGFVLTEFYVSALEKLANGEVSKIYGTFSEGTEWGSYDVESSGVLECTTTP